jgi:hypothetical protein
LLISRVRRKMVWVTGVVNITGQEKEGLVYWCCNITCQEKDGLGC